MGWFGDAIASAGWPASITLLILLLFQPLFILMMCFILRLCGVNEKDRSAWALEHAGKDRAIEFIRAFRGRYSQLEKLPPAEDPADEEGKD